MVQTCSKCSRANPGDAVYCYYDGLVLGGHARAGGPVAVGAQPFASPFVFPTGKACRSFDELALVCQEDWKTARDLLKQGYLETFLGGLGRIDLVMAAKEASKFPDSDRGLDQFLSKLPSDVLEAPKLAVETQEINLGVLPVGSDGRTFDLRLENQGMRLLYGSITCSDGLWLSFADAPGAAEKHFQFGHDLALPVRVVGDRLRAGVKPLQAHLAIESNGGTATVIVRAEVPIKTFPDGVLAGAKSPRQVAEKAKAQPKEAAALFESGAVSAWYKANGWTYPVQGPAGSGLGAVQQFFEALGLTPAPKVEINVKSVALSASPGENVRHVLEVRTEEKKPIYANGVSNQPWLEVGRGKANGRVVTIPLSVPSAPNKPGQTLTASVTVHSNGNQRFVIPVTLQIAGGSAFDFEEAAPAPAPIEEPEAFEVVEAVTAAPVAPAPVRPMPTPSAPAYQPSPRYGATSRPVWVHLLPAALLGLALLIVVGVDFLTRAPASSGQSGDDGNGGLKGDPESWSFGNLKDKDPRLALQFGSSKQFGLQLVGVKDPRPEFPNKNKQLTFDDQGRTNNTIVNIEDSEYYFGEKTPDNRIVSNKELKNPRHGTITVMDFSDKKVRVKQHVEIVPGQSGVLDTCLVWYHIENYGDVPHKLGLRFMLDTYIGANDGVPFTAPGVKGFISDMREFKGKDVPPYIEAVEKPDDPKDPGAVVRMGLKNIRLPGIELVELDMLRITHYPPSGARQRWDVPLESIQEAPPDSCVALYWPYDIKNGEMKGKSTRDMAFTYGLSQLDIGAGGAGALALSTPDIVAPGTDFFVTAYVYNANKGDEVELTLPNGLTFAGGETPTKAVEEGGKRASVFWKVHAGAAGIFSIQAKSGGSKTKPHDVVVKSSSIFG
jgi:hypothetical protein